MIHSNVLSTAVLFVIQGKRMGGGGGGGGGGVLNKILYRQVHSEVQPLTPFIYRCIIFDRKGTPFLYLLLINDTPFT